MDTNTILLIALASITGPTGLWFYHVKSDVKIKKKLWKYYVFGSAILISAFLFYSGLGWGKEFFYLFEILPVAMAFLAIDQVEFCDNCGKVLQLQVFNDHQYCYKCGFKRF